MSLNPLEILNSEPLLKEVFSLIKRRDLKVFLVGGVLRDLLLKKNLILDFDFAVSKNALRLAKELSSKIGGSLVILDKEFGCARIVKKKKDKTYTLDFTDFKGKDINEDLYRRDFTINSLAIDLKQWEKAKDFNSILISPYKGLEDLKKGIIRMVSKKSLSEDPLRLVRAFSLAAEFKFKIEEETLREIRAQKSKLEKTAFERIRDELFKILSVDNSFIFLKDMDRIQILEKIIPEIKIMKRISQGPYHHLDVWEHSLETLNQLELLMKELNSDRNLRGYLNEIIASDRKRRELIKLGAILHDIGKPLAFKKREGKTIFHGHEKLGETLTENICRRLKLSIKEEDALKKIVYGHLRPGYLADNRLITPRARFRYFRDTGSEGVSILLISVADQRATRGPKAKEEDRKRHEKIVFGLIKEFFEKKKEKKLPRILTGYDLIKKLKLTPGPIFAKILNKVTELQVIGKIKTKKEALDIAKKIVKR